MHAVQGVKYQFALGASKGRRRQPGFTLIELLVVLVIIGIILSIATLSIGVLGRDNQIEEQARRLDAVISQVHEESELQGRDIGVFVERDGYLFMRYDYSAQSWQEMGDDDPLVAYRELPAGLQTRLWLDGREVILKTHTENERLAQSQSSSSSSSSSSVASLTDTSKNLRTPQIFLLSSGDVSPFELRIEREGSSFSWRLIGKADNTVTVEVADATK